ncbi:MAG: ExbD/TolR family protein [Roseateles asaccharophilus]|jgi:biopolymer transport protein ExbD|uniref:Outer membrane transport energization protein ExbD n=1 Tax=Roseateles asaccharophilus TaxID=582607 RepID=A0A4R6MTX1_9BURK|nr:biopolymer transporter ExbD [Roseateles asaccharophilus]MDN3546482.1 biopolymer transporter ExbD [Roseateles asaccharophilus]TDP05522.1 outer membrane transport energization protein ExbD [Roseateles asaccharophilus]
MQVQNETKPYDTINVTPMLDLAYVLLVVFILMTTASVQGLSITLPKPSNKPSTEKHELKIVQVMPGGQLMLNGAPVSAAELEQQLLAAKARDAGLTVAIKGDGRAHYEPVVQVVDLCNKLGLNMALVTSRIGS